MNARLPHLSSCARRLAGFVGASLLLHALTVMSIPPSGVAGAPYSGPASAEPLHATLNRSTPNAAAPNDAPHARPGDERQAQAAAERAGAPGGASLPYGDKWYTAEEVDVRAAPVGEVHLDYPEELAGSGTRGRVFVLLFIDERGVVRNIRVTEAHPPRLFDAAARRAWKDVRFSPARKGGVAVKSQKLLELAFTPS